MALWMDIGRGWARGRPCRLLVSFNNPSPPMTLGNLNE